MPAFGDDRDPVPGANFGHPCRYLLFDPGSGELVAGVFGPRR